MIMAFFMDHLLPLPSSGTIFAIAPLAGAAIAYGGSALLGGLFNMFSNNSTNKQNSRIAQAQMQFQKNMADHWYPQQQRWLQQNMYLSQALNNQSQDRTNRFNVDFWKMQNEYNTPSAQMQRYLDAGINPYNALGNISSGQAESLSSANFGSINASAPSTPIPSGASYSAISNAGAFDVFTNAMGNIVGQLMNVYQNPATNPRTMQQWARTTNIDNAVQESTASARINAAKTQSLIMDEQLKSARSEATKQLFEMHMAESRATALPEQLSLELARAGAEVVFYLERNLLTRNEAFLAVKRAVKTAYETSGIKINNNILRRTANYLIRSAKAAASISEYEAENLRDYGSKQAPSYEESVASGKLDAGIRTPVGGISAGGELRSTSRSYKKRSR